MSRENDTLDARKDRHSHISIPAAWRPTLRDIVARLVRQDYSIEGIPSVEVSEGMAAQMEEYVADYGETLLELPDESWASSVAQWTGVYWDTVVDLWTAESGKSDLVLSVRVFEEGDGFRFEVDGVFVP